MMMRYYDRERDNLVDGLYFSAELLALLSDVMRWEPSDHELGLSAEGLAGLQGLLTMIYQCIHDTSRQLHEDSVWPAAAALHLYLQAQPEAGEPLREFLDQARQQEFISWGTLRLEQASE